MEFFTDVEMTMVVPVVLSVIAGSLIGIEREMRRKAAGVGTNMLICSAAAVFTLISALDPESPSRIAANILTGVGFIGAGLILRDGAENIHGLTTAAGIWMAAAIGMAFGYHYYFLGTLGTIIAVWAPRIPRWIYHARAKEVVSSTIDIVDPQPKKPAPTTPPAVKKD